VGTYIKGDGAPFLDQEILKRLLRYSKKTGEWIWRYRPEARACWNTRYAGKKAGYAWSDPKGAAIVYWVIRIMDYPFFAHRLAVLYVTGEWPTEVVDHRDLDGTNNRWNNLRAANNSQNACNRLLSKNNKTGFKGVSICSKTGRYRATTGIGGRWTQIGIFDTAEEASAAYGAEATKRAGEFARMS
jgi:hypothetical protein